MNLAIIGTGYVGLVSGTCFAELGHRVHCVDTDESKISALKKAQIPIYEPGLHELVEKNLHDGRLEFTTESGSAVQDADAVFIAVGTPSSRRGDGYADLSYVYQAAEDISKNLNGYTVIVDKSTVPIGTARNVCRIIRESNPGADFDVVSNPEFLREGAAVNDFLKPDRIIVGAETQRAADVMEAIYKPLLLEQRPFLLTNLETAEMVKYAANAFLATKISFINEIANLCEAVGANVVDVAKGIGLDTRIGKAFLQAGPGYGGSCFPKDTRALLRIAQENGCALRIVEAVVEVNEAQKARMVNKIRNAIGPDTIGKTICFLGLSYKQETDDMRESPALTIIPRLTEMGAKINAHDPAAAKSAKELLPEITIFDNEYEAACGADAVVLLTEWNQYGTLDLRKLKSMMKTPVFVDLRNLYDPKKMKEIGFEYYSVGR